jgi:hypothetical protein
VGHTGEVADGECCCHQAIVNLPRTGQSIEDRALDPPAKGAPRLDSSASSTNYFTVRDGQIVSLFVIRITPASY